MSPRVVQAMGGHRWVFLEFSFEEDRYFHEKLGQGVDISPQPSHIGLLASVPGFAYLPSQPSFRKPIKATPDIPQTQSAPSAIRPFPPLVSAPTEVGAPIETRLRFAPGLDLNQRTIILISTTIANGKPAYTQTSFNIENVVEMAARYQTVIVHQREKHDKALADLLASTTTQLSHTVENKSYILARAVIYLDFLEVEIYRCLEIMQQVLRIWRSAEHLGRPHREIQHDLSRDYFAHMMETLEALDSARVSVLEMEQNGYTIDLGDETAVFPTPHARTMVLKEALRRLSPSKFIEDGTLTILFRLSLARSEMLQTVIRYEIAVHVCYYHREAFDFMGREAKDGEVAGAAEWKGYEDPMDCWLMDTLCKVHEKLDRMAPILTVVAEFWEWESGAEEGNTYARLRSSHSEELAEILATFAEVEFVFDVMDERVQAGVGVQNAREDVNGAGKQQKGRSDADVEGRIKSFVLLALCVWCLLVRCLGRALSGSQ
jgi:hypothetical protein